MKENPNIPEFAMMKDQLRLPPWFPWPPGDPVPYIYDLLDKVKQAKVVPVLIKHYGKILEMQQRVIQEMYEIQRETLKEVEKILR
jgi:hypothetical protein